MLAGLYTPNGIESASRSWHAYVRDHVLPHADETRPVVYNSWEAMEFDVNETNQKSLAARAAALGCELFVMDDGWFGARTDDTAGLGDWTVNTEKFPRRAGSVDRRGAPAGHAVRAVGGAGDGEPGQRIDHVRYVYAIVDRLRADHPGLRIEACSGGGGRIDLGMLARTDQAWTSDNTDALDRIHIQRGYSTLYPARTMSAWVTDSPNQLTGRVIPLAFRFHVAMAGVLGHRREPAELDAGGTGRGHRSAAAVQGNPARRPARRAVRAFGGAGHRRPVHPGRRGCGPVVAAHCQLRQAATPCAPQGFEPVSPLSFRCGRIQRGGPAAPRPGSHVADRRLRQHNAPPDRTPPT